MIIVCKTSYCVCVQKLCFCTHTRAHTSLSTSREKLRRERVILLQSCVSSIFQKYQCAKDFSNRNASIKKVNVTARPLQQKYTLSKKGIRRTVTNTFMKNGKRCRYQNMLRKSLLTL